MLLVQAFCEKDASRSLEWFQWARELEGALTNHACLLIVPKGCPKESYVPVREAAEMVFATVDTISPLYPDERAHPWAANNMFRTACAYAFQKWRKPWLWCENDAIPLKKGWLDSIETAYRKCGTPFMGCEFVRPFRHLNGNAVYPPDVRKHAPAMLRRTAQPFDVAQPLSLKQATATRLIQSVWGDRATNTPPPIPRVLNELIWPEAVLFHRNKDGSLIRKLRKWNKNVVRNRRYKGRKYDWTHGGKVAALKAPASPLPEREIKKRPELCPTGAPEVCLVCLGRYGDIINILPIAFHIAQTYGPPVFMVAKQFADVLDGVGYVKPMVVDMGYWELNKAESLAKSQYPIVIVAQAWGAERNYTKLCQTFSEEQWRLAGFINEYGNPSWRVIFDRRNAEREHKLVEAHTRNGESFIFANLLNSTSGHYADGPALNEALKATLSNRIKVLDVSKITAERIYDMLALMEKASLLVSIDTAWLHLANATNTPVVALINPMPWAGAKPRSHVVSQFLYPEATKSPKRILSAIEKALKYPPPVLPPVEYSTPPKRQIYHAVERHDNQRGPDQKRKLVAWESWDRLYQSNQIIPKHYAEYERDSRCLGDSRGLPFLKDVLAAAMKGAQDDDVILWTNDDSILNRELPGSVIAYCAIWGACSFFRAEITSVEHGLLEQPARMWRQLNSRQRGTHRKHVGRDAFAATKRWLNEQWDSLPDFVLGAPEFDLCLACMSRLSAVPVITEAPLSEPLAPFEPERGYIGHIRHKPEWTSQVLSAGHIHNKRLFEAWRKRWAPKLNIL